jgi:myosin-crossreactive antigen
MSTQPEESIQRKLLNYDPNEDATWPEKCKATNRHEYHHWLSFTVTLKDPEFFDKIDQWTGNKAGTGALITFKDSAWLMSIVVPHQPHFLNQAEGTQVFWATDSSLTKSETSSGSLCPKVPDRES